MFDICAANYCKVLESFAKVVNCAARVSYVQPVVRSIAILEAQVYSSDPSKLLLVRIFLRRKRQGVLRHVDMT